ncbi:MAG: metal-sensing transcriptional repressor [Bacilli bacterium]|nr:metal-sensing transcriptional repressor [Bacilli bacterium]
MRANKEKVTQMLKIARGQLEAVINMVEEDRYCIDVSNQILAIISILRNANKEILNAHLSGCVKEALGEEAQEKVEEIMQIIDKLAK